MNEKLFNYFLTIAEVKNLSKDAEKLYISQPSLTQYLNRLENEWGIKLFDRSKSPLQLTYAGEKYLQYIIEVTEMNKKLLEEFDNIKLDCNGRITLGINTQRGAYMLPDIIPEFQKRFPKVEIKIKEGSSDYLENLILKNELDFCFLNLISYSDQFEYEHLMQEKILLISSKENPLVKNISTNIGNPSHIDLQIFKDKEFISLLPTQNLSVLIHSLFAKHGFKQKVAIETSNLTTAINLIAANTDYFTFLPEVYARHAPNQMKLSFFTVDSPILNWPLEIVYKKDTYLSKAAKEFIKISKEKFF